MGACEVPTACGLSVEGTAEPLDAQRACVEAAQLDGWCSPVGFKSAGRGGQSDSPCIQEVWALISHVFESLMVSTNDRVTHSAYFYPLGLVVLLAVLGNTSESNALPSMLECDDASNQVIVYAQRSSQTLASPGTSGPPRARRYSCLQPKSRYTVANSFEATHGPTRHFYSACCAPETSKMMSLEAQTTPLGAQKSLEGGGILALEFSRQMDRTMAHFTLSCALVQRSVRQRLLCAQQGQLPVEGDTL